MLYRIDHCHFAIRYVTKKHTRTHTRVLKKLLQRQSEREKSRKITKKKWSFERKLVETETATKATIKKKPKK